MAKSSQLSFWARGALATIVALVGIALALSALASNRSRQGKATVLLFLSTDCPVAMKYTPRINQIVKEFEPQGVAFKAYFPNDLETQTGISAYCSDRSYTFPALLDLGGERAKQLGIDKVPMVVVLDAQGKAVYKGAIDDNRDGTMVKQRYLQTVLKEVLGGQKPSFNNTSTFGCVLMAGDPLPAQSKVTYAEHIKPIFDRSCVKCHRPGEVALFSLEEYENSRKWAPMAKIVTQSKRMPPWKAVHGYGEFQNENRLSEREIELIKRWADGGAARGDAKKEPPTPKFPAQEWALGTPDAIVAPEKPYNVSAEGQDDYRHFIIKTNYSETKFVRAMAVKPGNAKVVHHVIAFIDEKGASHRLDAKDGQPGYSTFGGVGFLPDGSFGGWAPGNNPLETPDGVAFELKPGATIVLQVHYHKTGKPETDLTKVGLYFAKGKVEKVMSLAWMANLRLRIPAGEKQAVQKQTVPIPADITLYALMPHMHLLGREMRADVEFPDGRTQPLIYVKDWDFNWQLNYALLEPMKIPKGSKIHITATYDNSSDNMHNPNNPPKEVRWGEETTDEMMLLVAAYTIDEGMRPHAAFMGFGVPESEAKKGLRGLLDRLSNRNNP
jgi:thiol-disulfide isomerase/thioredoxin